MATANETFLFQLLQACAAAEPQPLYPVHFSRERNIDREMLDEGLDELRRRGLVHLTEWMKGFGQGCALTEAGRHALVTRQLAPAHSTSVAPSHSGSTADPYDRGEIARAPFLVRRTPYVTRIILALNLLYFAYGAFFAWQQGLVVNDYLVGGGRTTIFVLAELGALHPKLVFPKTDAPDSRPEFERIILMCFLHIGAIHLGMNMYMLGSIGPLIEAMWGPIRFLAIYMVAAIVSGCMVLLIAEVRPENAALTAGASGALFGIFAALLVWFGLNQQYLPRSFVQDWSRNLGLNLVLLIGINFIGGVSWQGHLGGAIGGFLAALLLHVQRFHPSGIVRILAGIAVPIVPAAFFVAVLWQAGWWR